MRLWHKDLIPALPRKQLLGQWRECCAIARSISVKGSPNHVLVNRIMDYPLSHFMRYSREVFYEMRRRGYSCDWQKFAKHWKNPHDGWKLMMDDIFPDWHNAKYLLQCYYNLEEKHGCGAISDEEWNKIVSEVYGL